MKQALDISLRHAYPCARGQIFAAVESGRFFELTGAAAVQIQFSVDGEFQLDFGDRGRVFGQFVRVDEDCIQFKWNVSGFGREPEVDTLVTVRLTEQGPAACLLELTHEHVRHADSATAKRRAWTELLDHLQAEL